MSPSFHPLKQPLDDIFLCELSPDAILTPIQLISVQQNSLNSMKDVENDLHNVKFQPKLNISTWNLTFNGDSDNLSSNA